MEKVMGEKEGLLLVIGYLVLHLLLDTKLTVRILLKVADASFWYKYVDLLVYLLFALGLIIIYYGILLESFRDFIKNRDRYLHACGWVGIMTVVMMVVTAIILSRFSIGKSANQEMIDVRMQSNRLIMTLVVCLIGPFVEEMIFRGIVYEKIRKGKESKLGIAVAILSTSLLFAIYHSSVIYIVMNGDYKQLLEYLPIFVLGVGLNYIYVKTHNVFAPVVVHMCINIFSSFG